MANAWSVNALDALEIQIASLSFLSAPADKRRRMMSLYDWLVWDVSR